MEDSRDNFKFQSRRSYNSGKSSFISPRPYTAPEPQRRLPTPRKSPPPDSTHRGAGGARIYSVNSGKSSLISPRPYTAPEPQRRLPTPRKSPPPDSTHRGAGGARIYSVNSTPSSRESVREFNRCGNFSSGQSTRDGSTVPSAASSSWSVRRQGSSMPASVQLLRTSDARSSGPLDSGTVASRRELPPRELITAAIRRIMEDPPTPRQKITVMEESSLHSTRRKKRRAPTGGNGRRYPPGLLCESSDEGHDTDWYPQKWEDVLGPAVANLPPSHFYRSWRTNSRGVLHYLLGSRLDDQEAGPPRQPYEPSLAESTSSYGEFADPYCKPARDNYAGSRGE